MKALVRRKLHFVMAKSVAAHRRKAHSPPRFEIIVHEQVRIHAVRNSLNVIMGFADLLLAHEIDEETRHGLNHILSAAHRMAEILEITQPK